MQCCGNFGQDYFILGRLRKAANHIIGALCVVLRPLYLIYFLFLLELPIQKKPEICMPGRDRWRWKKVVHAQPSEKLHT